MDAQENPYDEVPYPVLSHSETHPDRIAIVAALLGLDPVPVDDCRVLEVGAGIGGNIIPMAAALPGSQFVGIDYARVQVNRANELIAELGLENIRFECADLRDYDPAGLPFDYVIAHGIYSWVPPEVRDGLLALCNRVLSERGIAYVSYNTLPGWYLSLALREVMLLGARSATTPRGRLDGAIETIELFREHAAAGSQLAEVIAGYSALEEARRSMGEAEADALMLHDHLEVNNKAFYLYEFVDQAAAHGLDYLGDAEFSTLFPNGVAAQTVSAISKRATSRIDFEQHLDFLKNRSFRRSLLCRDASQVRSSLNPRPELMRRLYVRARAHSEADVPLGDDSRATFANAKGAKLTTNHPLSKAALLELGAAWPRSLRVGDLPALAVRRLANAGIDAVVTEADERLIWANLLQGFSYDAALVELRTWAPRIVTEPGSRPVASAYARVAAARGIANPPNMYHLRVSLEPQQAALLTLLDGEHDRDALYAAMSEVMTADEGAAGAEPTLRLFIDETIEFFAETGLLVG